MTTHLVIQLARFGDLLQSKRLLLSLAAEPDSRVHVLVDHSLKPLARTVYPGIEVHSIQAHGGGRRADGVLLAELTACAGEIVDICPDQVINLNFSGLNFSLASLFPPEIVRGYRVQDGQWLKDSWAERGFRLSADRKISPLNLVDLWAGYASSPLPPATVNPCPAAGGAGVGIVLAGRHARRSLPMETLALLAGAALEKVGHGPIFLFGTRAEQRMAKDLQTCLRPAARNEIRDLTGRTNLDGLADHLQNLDLLLTPDTGTMHLGAHLGTPVLAFFLASAWCHETGPYGAGHRVIQAIQPCSPCAERDICHHGIACSQSFSSRALLRYVSGRPVREWPSDMTLFQSRFDAQGVWFDPLAGTDQYAVDRAALRGLMGVHQHLFSQPPHPASSSLVYDFYRERDWMLDDASTIF